MSDREELARLRRLRELEAKASGGATQSQTQPQKLHYRKAEQSDKRLGGFSDFAQGAKGGFDRAAYGLGQAIDTVVPDLPISKETRDAYNQNPVVRTLGLTIPSREERQSAIEQSRRVANDSTAGMIGDMIGNAAPSIAAGAATAGGTVVPAMATQAGFNFLTTPGNVGERAVSGVMAAGGEAAGRALPRVLARVVKPINPTPAAQRMIDWGGIYPTPAQAAGGIFKSLEDYSTSVPGWGHAVQGAQDKLREKAAGLAMSQGSISVPPGREGYKLLSEHFDNAFANATRPLAFDLNDPAFNAGIQSIMRNNNLDGAGIADINRFLKTYKQNMNMGGAPGTGLAVPGQAPQRQLLSGEDFHKLLQKVRNRGSGFRKLDDPYKKDLGQAYREIYDLADNSLSTQGIANSADVQAFRDVRNDYARVAPALKAGELNTVVRNKGVFTPEQYQNAVANNAKSMGNTRALREGTLPQQQLADDMVELFGGRPPDSGTATRSVLTGLIPGASMFASPAASAMAVGGMGLGYGLGKMYYSDPVRKYMLGGYSGQKAIAEALRNFAPYSGTAGAAFAPDLTNK